MPIPARRYYLLNRKLFQPDGSEPVKEGLNLCRRRVVPDAEISSLKSGRITPLDRQSRGLSSRSSRSFRHPLFRLLPPPYSLLLAYIIDQ